MGRALLAVCCVAGILHAADRLRAAVRVGDVARTRALLKSRPPQDPQWYCEEACRRGHLGVAMVLVSGGAKLDPGLVRGLLKNCRDKAVDAEDAQALREAVPHDPANVGSVLWRLAPKTAPHVMQWLDDKDPQVRRAAAATLGAYLEGNVTLMAALTKALQDSDVEVRRLAACACGRLRWPKGAKGDLGAARKALLLALASIRGHHDVGGDAARVVDAVLKRKGEVGVPGHPAGRLQRIRRDRQLRRAIAEPSVARGLAWLVSIQFPPDGRWDSDTQGGGPLYDVALTGLVALALLGAGHVPGTSTEHAESARDGLDFLIDNQDKDGCFGSRASQHFVYAHILATTAVLDATIMTGDPAYRSAAVRGVRFIEWFRGGKAGWRYEPRGPETDTSVTCLAGRALHLARLAGIGVDAAAIAAVDRWIASMTGKKGRIGYNTRGGLPARPEHGHEKWPAKLSRAMEATALLTRMLLLEGFNGSRLAADLAKHRPEWTRGKTDMYYWLWGTMALHQVGGKHWRTWKKALSAAVPPNQAKDGSWPPVGPWGRDGGRIYSTTFMVLALETSYRHARPK